MLFAHAKISPEGDRAGASLDAPAGKWHGRHMEGDGRFARRSARTGEATALGDLLRDVARPALRQMGHGRSGIAQQWPQLVGPLLAQHSTPLAVRYPPGRRAGGTLDIMVDRAQAGALRDLSADLLEQINQLFGYPAVAQINIRPRL